MTKNDLYDGFESYRIPAPEDIDHALKHGIFAIDTNVLLNLYRYNEQTVNDLLAIIQAAQSRLFIPHQVVREFWRNRQSVIGSLGAATKEAHSAFSKNAASTKDAIGRWAKSVALPLDQQQELTNGVDAFFSSLHSQLGTDPKRIAAHAPTDEDTLLGRLEELLSGSVGPALSPIDWDEAVVEGERRVANQIPPGYMDIDKLDSELPEQASGDYIVWKQLLIEASDNDRDLVLVTSDTKEDWWNRTERGKLVGPRVELLDEFYGHSKRRLHLLEPGLLLSHSAAFGVGVSEESLQDIERVQNEELSSTPWSIEAVNAVLSELDAQGHVQGAAIREAAKNGGKILRERIYELDGRDESQTLRGFTRPVTRVTTELQANELIPYGMTKLLRSLYETGVKSSHFGVPHEVVELLREGREALA